MNILVNRTTLINELDKKKKKQ